MKFSNIGLSAIASSANLLLSLDLDYEGIIAPEIGPRIGPSYPHPGSRNGQVKVRCAAAKRRNIARNRRAHNRAGR